MRNKVSNIQHIPPRNHDSILQKLQDSKVWQAGRLLTNSLGWGHRCGLTWHNWYPYCWWTKSCTTKEDDYPIIYRVSTVPDGAGFLPSTVFPLLLVDGLNSSIETEKKRRWKTLFISVFEMICSLTNMFLKGWLDACLKWTPFLNLPQHNVCHQPDRCLSRQSGREVVWDHPNAQWN